MLDNPEDDTFCISLAGCMPKSGISNVVADISVNKQIQYAVDWQGSLSQTDRAGGFVSLSMGGVADP